MSPILTLRGRPGIGLMLAYLPQHSRPINCLTKERRQPLSESNPAHASHQHPRRGHALDQSRYAEIVRPQRGRALVLCFSRSGE